MTDRTDTPAAPATVRPAGAAGSVTVREYGTRYLRITVRYHGGTRFSWLRTRGPAHDQPQVPPSPEVGAALRAVDTAVAGSGARLALGDWDTPPEEDGVVYEVPAAVSVARLLPSGDETGYRLSVRALADQGRTLRRLHEVPWETGSGDTGFGEPPPHQGIRRLVDWLSGSSDTGARADAGAGVAGGSVPDGSRLRALAHDRLGPRLWARLAEWAAAAQEPPGRGGAVLLHGAPSTGWLVPSPAGDHTVLLTGEEVTGGDPALDLGWVLGELHELRSAASRGLGAAGQGPPVDYPAAARALLAGYLRKEAVVTEGSGEAPLFTEDDAAALPPGTARAATLRLAVHMRDFACFVGWHEDLRRYADLLAEALDAEGAPTLRW
ncbi:hypothetical protein OG875_20870 [Streptomyces sp. NBC_01498]|uniref:hypothetical protein n=1 Tax=Streptomyces sp. NBC_01498 TaxID=2975870 RepID=UPI002E7C38C7|nr:hypothetical protein [Streptomyces sp. NBC_01498]WTL26800.1 hypothetical protein OG875_20870 [Streptomyces sp. NBC_01498]